MGELLQLFPLRISQEQAPERIGLNEAVWLRRIDIKSRPGAVIRSRGFTRVNFSTALPASTLGSGVFRRRDETKTLIFSTGGTWYAQISPVPAYQDSDYGI